MQLKWLMDEKQIPYPAADATTEPIDDAVADVGVSASALSE